MDWTGKPRTHEGTRTDWTGRLRTHEGTRTERLHAVAAMRTSAGDLEAAVRRPEGEDEDEWLSTHAVDFHNEISLCWALVEDGVTLEAFPAFFASPRHRILWEDGDAYPTPTALPAREYVDRLLAWVDAQLGDDALFPSRAGTPFPPGFRDAVSKIFRRMLRILAHIYHFQWERVEARDGADVVNTVTKHFALFATEHALLSEADFACAQPFLGLLLARS
jgi:MOB kinase activator 1